MTLLRVDNVGNEPCPGHLGLLDAALRQQPFAGSVTVMTHGYRYAPDDPVHDPNDHILGPVGGNGRSLSWPRHLGFRDANHAPGLAVALGWNARGTIWAAHRASGQAATGLAQVLTRIRARRPDLRITAIGHSLGARVILQALPQLAQGTLARAVLLAAAAFRAETLAALATPGGSGVEVVNVTSRENDLFDGLIEAILPGGWSGSIGHGLGQSHRGWVDLQLDHPEVMRGLARLGFPVGDPARRICHWSAYRRPGVFALYRALLTDPALLPLELLARALPQRQHPRWSRLLSPFPTALPLPFRRGTST
ncbi:MAG: hypothetical protein RLZZ528_1258 [Pseudomonadota bacterium]